MSEWKHMAGVIEFKACRTGWRGVWDAIVALFENKPRLESNQARTIEYWFKENEMSATSDGENVKHTLYINGTKVNEIKAP